MNIDEKKQPEIVPNNHGIQNLLKSDAYRYAVVSFLTATELSTSELAKILGVIPSRASNICTVLCAVSIIESNRHTQVGNTKFPIYRIYQPNKEFFERKYSVWLNSFADNEEIVNATKEVINQR